MAMRWAEGSGQQALRKQNLSRLLHEVHVAGPLSRSDLGARMGVNRSTVGSLVTELAARGLVRERPPAATALPGRPSPLVEPRPDGPVVLAAEIATDSLAAAVIGLGGVIVKATRVDRARAWRQPPETLRDLMGLARPLVDGLGDGQALLAAGVSVPGTVRRDDGLVHIAPNLGWRGVPLARMVREELALDVPVLVGNDADLAARSEHMRGAGVGRRDFICLWGEAGLGAGIVAGGWPLAGAAGYAGEVGHMPVNPNGLPCHCGSRGCWETEVGEDALLRYAGRRATDRGRADLEEIFAAADAGAAPALAALETVGHWLGVGIAGLVDIFNPSGIALGGLYARLYPYVHEIVEAQIAARAITASRDLVTIMPVSLGADAALLGAAELALERVLDDPTVLPMRRRMEPVA